MHYAKWWWPRRFRRTSRRFASSRGVGGSPTSRRCRDVVRRRSACVLCAARRERRPAGVATPVSSAMWRCSCSPPGEVRCAFGFEGFQRLGHVVTARQERLTAVFQFERGRERGDFHIGLQCAFGYPDAAGGVGTDLSRQCERLVEQVIVTGHPVEQAEPFGLLC